MRHSQIFAGSSHPQLVERICERLGQKRGDVELKKFANGETSVQIQTSVRDKDVFIVQSGSHKINDDVMELLIMISACKGGSSRSITAVMPYFPYSRQSKKKSHRGAITARMLANLLHVAGVNHVITIDLHASQMQGFFKCPVDNLVAEPLLARWIRVNIPDWREAVVVSKNPGGTKRVTSLADALQISFGMVTTDRRRPYQPGYLSMNNSAIFERLGADGTYENDNNNEDVNEMQLDAEEQITPTGAHVQSSPRRENQRPEHSRHGHHLSNGNGVHPRRLANGTSPLARSTHVDDHADSRNSTHLSRVQTAPTNLDHPAADSEDEEYNDERARDVVHSRLVNGHVVDDDYPSPVMSTTSMSTTNGLSRQPTIRTRQNSDDEHNSSSNDPMLASFMSTTSSSRYAEQPLGGSGDAAVNSDEEEDDLNNPDLETTVTLVGNVRDRPVFIVDDIIDKAGSWIAAAETVVKRGGATKVYCMATHGLFGGDCLAEMEACDEIDTVIVTNAFPVDRLMAERSSKLVQLDVSGLLSEAIRRNHHGESISQLFAHDH